MFPFNQQTARKAQSTPMKSIKIPFEVAATIPHTIQRGRESQNVSFQFSKLISERI